MGLYDKCSNMNDVLALSEGRSIMSAAQAEETLYRCPICNTSYESVLLDDRLEDTKFWYIAQCFCNTSALRHYEYLSEAEKKALIQNELERAKEKERAYAEKQQKKAEQNRIYEEQRRREEQSRRRAEQLQWEREAPIRQKRERQAKARKVLLTIGFIASILCAVFSGIMFVTIYTEISGLVIFHILPFIFLLFTSSVDKAFRIVGLAVNFIVGALELNWITNFILGSRRTIELLFTIINDNVTFNFIGMFNYAPVNIIFIPIISSITACILIVIFPRENL